MKKKILASLVISLFLISGCAQQGTSNQQGPPNEDTNDQVAGPASDENQAQIANPASVYCEEHGGTLEIRTNADGAQQGFCKFSDGSECDEWAYYRNECPKEQEQEPVSTNPVDSLNDSTIQEWGADCGDKATDLDNANCILDWQEKNIFWCYTHPEEPAMPNMFEAGYPDCVVDMQFQQMLPGSFPVSKIMEIKTRNGKLFGACYTYATTYCSVARWNGLTCRVMWATIPETYSAPQGDYATGYCGLAQKSYLDSLGYDCDDWRVLDWAMNAGHYWAEVMINGQWKIMEKSIWAYKHDTQKNVIDAGMPSEDTGW